MRAKRDRRGRRSAPEISHTQPLALHVSRWEHGSFVSNSDRMRAVLPVPHAVVPSLLAVLSFLLSEVPCVLPELPFGMASLTLSVFGPARQLVEEAAAFADLDADGKDRDDATAAVIFW